MPYATVAQMRANLKQINLSADSDALLLEKLNAATQVIDTELGFSFGTAAAGTRVVYGDGTDYLEPPAFVTGSVTAVTAPTGYTVPTYTVINGVLIVTRDGLIGPYYGADSLSGRLYDPLGGWLAGVPYTVAATYGYSAVPADIVECCLELAVRMWRARDAGFSDVVGVDGAGAVGYNGKYPALVKAILENYKADRPSGRGVW